MIPGGGWTASFKRSKRPEVGGYFWTFEPIVCWVDTDDGPVGMIANEHRNRKSLTRADFVPDFDGYELGGEALWDTRVTQILPAPGVSVIYKDGDGSERSEPVDLWAVCEDGRIRPVVFMGEEGFSDPSGAANFLRYQVEHPACVTG